MNEGPLVPASQDMDEQLTLLDELRRLLTHVLEWHVSYHVSGTWSVCLGGQESCDATGEGPSLLEALRAAKANHLRREPEEP